MAEEELTEKDRKFVSEYKRLYSEGRLSYKTLSEAVGIPEYSLSSYMQKMRAKNPDLPLMRRVSPNPRLTPNEYVFCQKMEELSSKGPVTKREIAEATGLRYDSINKIMKSLDSRGIKIKGQLVPPKNSMMSLQLLSNRGKGMPDIRLTREQADVYSAMEDLSSKNRVEMKELARRISEGRGKKISESSIHAARGAMKKKGLKIPEVYIR
jgi:DNA-binding Lrp family transcriptional regulator